MLARALVVRPQPPANWAAGQIVRYTVLRDGRELGLNVSLACLPAAAVIGEFAGHYLSHPVLLPALLIGLLVFLWKPRSLAARLLFLICACMFASEGISQIVGDTNVLGPAVLFDPVYWPAQFFNSLIWPLVIAPLFLHLFLSFPSLLWPLRAHPRLAPALLYGFMPGLSLLALALNWGRPLDAWGTWATFSVFDYFATLISVILSMAYTLATVRDPARRAQVRWVAWGALVTCAGAIVGGVLGLLGAVGTYPLLDFVIYRLPILAFPTALAIAITRYRLFEIDIIINRTLVYGVLTAVLALVYAGSVILLQALFRVVTHEGHDALVTAGSTLAIAVLFSPLRGRIQAAIDRRFYRRKYNAAQMLQSFSITLRDDVDLDRLANNLLVVVEEAMQPTYVSLWLYPTTGGVPSRFGMRMPPGMSPAPPDYRVPVNGHSP
jgi:hypothetical protein